MNIQQLKYVVAVSECGSISKAAEKLFIGQPNISRAIKDLEEELKIDIFYRSTKGIELTPNGDKLVTYARSILQQIDDVENLFKEPKVKTEKIAISAPRASYIGIAIANFSNKIKDIDDLEVIYKETNSSMAIKNVTEEGYNMAILRYATMYDDYYEKLFVEKNLKAEVLYKFNYVLVMNKDNVLANDDNITHEKLEAQTEIAHADPYVPSLSLATVMKDELGEKFKRRIFVFERASQFEILSKNKEAFMWVSPIPSETLDRYGLIQKDVDLKTKEYKDMLIYKKNYKLSKLDSLLITELVNSKRKVKID